MNDILSAPYRAAWSGKNFFKKLFWTAASSCALGGLYAWKLEDHWLRIEQQDMPLCGLASGLSGAKLAHISDLHSSAIVLEKYLRQCVEAINALEVDFVAITGDFISGSWRHARRVAKTLKGLRPRVATVACLGNHDYGIYHPRGRGPKPGLAEHLADELTHADIFVMLNESRTFFRNGAALEFVGVEDYWSPRYNPYLAFEMSTSAAPVVALCHNPDAALQLASCGAQWVLAGHTHGSTKSEIVSSVVIPSAQKHFIGGRYDLGEDHWLYVNRGLAYARRTNVNTRPEITVFTLRQA